MTNKPHYSKISLENFGIIENANIDIAPLTVLIGPNSSGKSFIAKLIHCFNKNEEDDLLENTASQIINSLKFLSEDDEKLLMQITSKIKNNFNSSKPLKISYDELYPLIQSGFLIYLSDLLKEEIEDEFGENLDGLITFSQDSFRINIKNSKIEKTRNRDLEINLELPLFESGDEKINIDIHGDDEYIYINLQDNPIEETFNEMKEFLKIYAVISLLLLDNLLLEHSYYIPAERSEIIMDNKLLTRKVLNKSELSKNQSEVLANIIKINPENKSPFYELGCDLEEEFSGVHAIVDDKNIFNNVIFKDSKNQEISSKILSTSIHELSVFSLYLKYVLKKGDLLIIEEPEAHMHPKNQRILVKYFTRAINQGLKIMITTHSDYIISQLDNMINLNNVSKETLKELNYSSEDILKSEDIKIYNFKKNMNNTYSAVDIAIQKDGFVEDNFSKITDELYEETINIRNSYCGD